MSYLGIVNIFYQSYGSLQLKPVCFHAALM